MSSTERQSWSSRARRCKGRAHLDEEVEPGVDVRFETRHLKDSEADEADWLSFEYSCRDL